MSVFRNSFDCFGHYANRNTLTVPAHGLPPTGAATESDVLEMLQTEQTEATFDPFNWLFGADFSNAALAPTAPAITAANDAQSSAPVSANLDVAQHVGLDSVGVDSIDISPADHWLSGNEWHDGLSAGTVDTTGQGNDVFSVGGEVLSLPT